MGIIRRAGMIALVAGVTACGGGDGGSNDTTEPPSDQGTESTTGAGGEGEGTTEELVRAATTHFEAFLTRDDDVYFELMSQACRERLGFGSVAGHLDGRHFRAGLDGVDLDALSVADVTVDGEGETATVQLVIEGPNGDQFRETLPHNWIYEDGGWHMDDCADFREAQGGLEGVGMDRNDPLPLGGVADVNGWLVALIGGSPDDEALIVETGGVPAADGNQLFTAQLTVSYNGAEPSIVYGQELAFAMVNGDVVYGDEADCIGPDSALYLDPDTEVGPGESVGAPILCREVSADHADGMLLRIGHVASGGEWWFSLDGP